MIGVSGQYLFSLETELGQPIVDVNSLVSFNSIESCDLLMPVFKIMFFLNDNKNLGYFNEGSIIKLALGKDKKTLTYINLQVTKIQESTSQERFINMEATLYKPTYSKNTKTLLHKNKTSVEIINQIAKEYFTINSNISISSDRRNWVQFGVSDKSFVEHLWMNSYLDNGILATGVCSIDNIFVMKDLIKLFTSSDYDYKMSFTVGDKKKEIGISNILQTSGSYAFFNSWKAYPRYSINYNILTDTFDDYSFKLNNLSSLSDKNNVNSKVTKEIKNITTYSDSKYSFSKEYNLFALSNYSKYSIEVSCIGEFIPIKLLDKIYLDLDKNNLDNQEYFSGNYVVCKVVRNISNNKIITKVQLCRESPGRVKGKDIN